MLRRGADPNVTLWRSPGDEAAWTALAAYLNLAFEVPRDPSREALYHQVLQDFLQAGATLDPVCAKFRSRFLQETLSSTTRVAMPSEKFFGRLNSMQAVDLRACNIGLLGEVVDVLLFTVGNSQVTLLNRIRTAVEAVFPAEICERLRIKYPGISWSVGSGELKRATDTELENNMVKRVKGS